MRFRRILKEPNKREVYVCYEEGIPQNMVEIAYKLSINATGQNNYYLIINNLNIMYRRNYNGMWVKISKFNFYFNNPKYPKSLNNPRFQTKREIF